MSSRGAHHHLPDTRVLSSVFDEALHTLFELGVDSLVFDTAVQPLGHDSFQGRLHLCVLPLRQFPHLLACSFQFISLVHRLCSYYRMEDSSLGVSVDVITWSALNTVGAEAIKSQSKCIYLPSNPAIRKLGCTHPSTPCSAPCSMLF